MSQIKRHTVLDMHDPRGRGDLWVKFLAETCNWKLLLPGEYKGEVWSTAKVIPCFAKLVLSMFAIGYTVQTFFISSQKFPSCCSPFSMVFIITVLFKPIHIITSIIVHPVDSAASTAIHPIHMQRPAFILHTMYSCSFNTPYTRAVSSIHSCTPCIGAVSTTIHQHSCTGCGKKVSHKVVSIFWDLLGILAQNFAHLLPVHTWKKSQAFTNKVGSSFLLIYYRTC